jgi:co-chaperonin GroES (HSP10)
MIFLMEIQTEINYHSDMKLLGTAILIKPDKIPERTKTGALVIPRTSKEVLTNWGEVVDAGSACKEVKVGMRVIFPRKSASVIVIDDKDYYFTNEHHIKYYE